MAGPGRFEHLPALTPVLHYDNIRLCEGAVIFRMQAGQR
jgi:hypothetical protein